MQCLLTCPPARMPAGRTTSSISNSSSTVHSEAAGTDRPPAPPADRATYVFSTRTIYLALPPSLACAACRCSSYAIKSVLRPPRAARPPASLPPPTNREGEKKEGEKELVDQPGDDGGGARSHSLTYRSRRAAWLAPLARSLAQVMSTYLPKQFVNRREGTKKATEAASGYLPQ